MEEGMTEFSISEAGVRMKARVTLGQSCNLQSGGDERVESSFIHVGCKEETFGYHEVELRGWYGKVFCGRRQKGWNHRVAGVSLDHDKDGSKAPSLRCVELESAHTQI